MVRALRDEQSVLETYRTLSRQSPSHRRQLAPLIAAQRRHVDVVCDALGLGEPPAPPAVHPPGAPVPQAVSQTAERAVLERLADCEAVAAGSVASLLASMAAAHQVVAALWAGP
jgi:hypothetical protein